MERNSAFPGREQGRADGQPAALANASAPLARAHFQLFALDEHAAIRWRLLSANNRELGRGCGGYATADECVAAVAALRAQLDALTPQARRREGNLWHWAFVVNDVTFAVSGHGYDRQLRAQQAAERFRRYALEARISETVTMTGGRRWTRAGMGLTVRHSHPRPPRQREQP